MIRWVSFSGVGQEFIGGNILLPETTRCSGALVVEKIRRRIADAPFCVNGDEIRITASIGFTKFGQESEVSRVSPFRPAEAAWSAPD